jgi:hypothetical protein
MKQTYWMVMDYLVQRKAGKRTSFSDSYFSQTEKKMLLSICVAAAGTTAATTTQITS